MIYKTNSVSDIKIAYIGGGSKGWAWGLMGDLADEKELSGIIRLYDIDESAAKSNEIIGNCLNEVDKAVGKWKYECAPTLEEALIGTDFVIISILPGTFKEMDSDVHTPEKYGIYQSVGDTVGPGGDIRALRTIPMYVTIAKAIKKYAPNAWVINYTNPMTLCVRTLYKIFPKIKAFGCCHEVFGTQNLISAALSDMEGIQDVPREDIKINVLGINHFTWLDKISYQGSDLMPLYKEFTNKYYESGYILDESSHWINNSFTSANRIKFDLFRRYGIVAAAGDRHLAEFCPGSWYLQNPDKVKAWMFGLTNVSSRVIDLKKREERSERLKNKEEFLIIGNSGEEGISMIKALLGLGDKITNVNLPNTGQMQDIPFDCVVETNAIFQKDSVTPVVAGILPNPVNGLVLRHVYNQEAILEAGLTCNKDLAFAAFANDPLVTCTLDNAESLFNEMLFNTKEYLAGWDI